MRSHAPWAALVLALAAGCSIMLDTSQEGLPCDATGACLEGYVCNGANVCVPEADGACKPECGKYQQCIRSKCVASCDDRPCGAGQECNQGVCEDLTRDRKLGAPCDADDGCTGAGVFCLKPYGGGIGMCTKECADSPSCGDHAPKCSTLPNGKGGDLKLCTAATFVGCRKEADCVDAGLSCGAFAVRPPSSDIKLALACRARVDNARAIGEVCSPGIPCANGLCLPVSGNGELRCVTPCSGTVDCADLVKDAGTACLSATLNGHLDERDLPRTRAMICVPGGASRLTSCETSAGSCRADAPDCVIFAGQTARVCAAPAADEGNACESGYTSKDATHDGAAGKYCGK